MHFLAILLVIIGLWDYLLGAIPNSPKVPLLGNYLTHTIDFILIFVGVGLFVMTRRKG